MEILATIFFIPIVVICGTILSVLILLLIGALLDAFLGI